MKSNKSMLAMVVLTITSSTVAFGQLRPGGPGAGQPGLTPGGAASGDQTVVAPAKKQLDARRLEELVKRSGEAFARDVIEIMGEAYQVRYNVREGILTGKGRLGDYDNISNVISSSTYRNSYASGQSMAQARGLEAGAAAANSTARGMADADINAAIDAAIDNGTAIVFKPNPRTAQFGGVDANLSYPSNVESRLMNNRLSRQSEMQRIMFNRLSSELVRSVFDMNSIYNRHDTALPEYLRGDSALRNYLDNTLNTSSGREGRDFYREIGGSDYETPSENRRAFERGFMAFYSRGVENMWSNKVMSMNSSARNLGENMYLQEAEAFASELGNFDGYKSAYRAASVTGFNNSIINAYNSNYADIKNSVQNSSYITSIEAAVIGEVDGKTEYSIGDTFDVVVNSAKNRGMKAGDLKLDIVTGGQVSSMDLNASIPVAGLSKLASQRIVRVGWLSDITEADQDVTVTALVGDRSVSATFKVTYEETIRKILNPATDSVTAGILMTKAMDYMKKQYDDLSGTKDQYKNRRADMLLVRIRALFDTLSEEQKNALRARGQEIRNVFGGKPSKFLGLNPKRDEWDSAQAMISEMGLSGNRP
ncbi:hypothetical protein K2P97_12015 [bacterium]|nr:hypothetical protein [bacterium]